MFCLFTISALVAAVSAIPQIQPASTVVVTPTVTVAPPTTITASTVFVTQTPVASVNSSTSALAVSNSSTVAGASINTVSFDEVLYTALGTSLFSLAATNPSSASAVIASELASNMTPTWYAALPTDIKSEVFVVTAVTAMNATATKVSNVTSITTSRSLW